jgi:hypothetical protein
LERTDDGGADIAFDLKFTKARERTPENRNDFEPVRITPAGDRWASTGAEPRPAGKPKEPSPLGQKFFDALLKMISEDGAPVRSERVDTGGRPAVSFDQWQAECKWRGLVDKDSR